MFERKNLSYDQFERDMQGRGYNTQIWKFLRDNGAEVSSHPWEFRKWAGVDEFDNTLWRKNAAKKAQQLVQRANTLQQRNAGIGNYIDGQKNKAVFNTDVNIAKKAKSNVVVNKATGKAYTQGGEEFNANDKAELQDAEKLQQLYDKRQQVYNEAVDNGMIADPMDVDAGLSDAEVKRRMMERRKAYATREMNKRGDEIDTQYAGMPQQFNSHTEPTMQAQGYKSSDQEYQLWKTAKQKSEDTMQMLDQQIREERQKKEDGDSWLSQTSSAISNFGKGIWDTVTDYRSWEPGITEMQEANTMLDAKRHMENGSIKEGSDEDIATQVMLTSLRDYDDQQRYQAANGSKAYSNGAMTGISLTLLPQFLITGGSSTLTEGGAKLLTKMGIKEAEKGFQKYAVKAMGRVLSDAARATVLTGALQGGKTYAAIMDDYLGVTNEKGATTYDKKGKLKFNEGKSLGRSIYDAGTQQYVENFSELMGEWLPGGEQIAQGLRHIGLSKVADMFAHIGSNGVYQALSNADRYTGVSGIFGEIMEEEFGIALNSLLNNGGSQWSDFVDGDKQFDLMAGLFFSVGAMNAPRYAAGAYSGVQYMRYKHYTDNAEKDAQNVLGGRWDSIRDVIDGTTNDDMTKVVRSYLSQKDKFTSVERNAISKYALNLSRMRGYNTALTANTAQEAEEAKNDPEKQEEMLRGQERNASYMLGANATADQRRGIQLGYEQSRKKLADSIGIEESELEQLSEDDILDKLQDDDQLDMTDDFLKKKAAHSGMQDAANQMVEDAKQQATAEVDKMTNQKTGTIQRATLKSIDEEEDKDVYVVGGNLVTFSGGTIDHENSDKMIVIYNPETKERETISPSRLLQVTEERTAQEVKDEAAETAAQKVQANNENDISGKVATGSVYSVIDETGATHTIEVGETNQDGTVNATYDGQPMISTIEALQQERNMSDAALTQVQSPTRAQSQTKQNDDESSLQGEETVADEVKDFVDNIEFDRMIDENGSIVPVDVENPEQGHTYYKTGQTGQGNSARYNVAEFDANMNYVGTHRMTASNVVLNDPMSVDEKKEQLRSSVVSEYLQSINEHQQERQAEENNDANDINDNVEEPQQEQREVDEVATDNVAESKEDTSALSRIPVDEKTQEPLFEQVDSETALQGLNELTGNNTNSVTAIVNAQVQQANKALETLKGKKPKKTTPKLQGSPMEMLKAQQQAEAKYESDMEKYNAQVDAAEQKVKVWNNIASAMLQEQEPKRKEKATETNEINNADASNEDATVKLSAKKRRALETAYVSQKEEHHPTVVSSADGAKVLKNIDNLVKNYENVSNQVKTFIGDVAKALGAERKGSKSEYATFETKNGKIVTIRLADHNAKVSNFDNRNELDGISIVISPKTNEGIINNGDAHVTEFFYDALKLRRADGKPLVDILNSIKQTLYSGEFKDKTGFVERQEVNGVDTNMLDNNTDSEVLDKVEEGHEGVTDWFMPKAMRKDIEKIAKKLGYNVQWLYTNDKSNGFFVGNTVYLSLNAERPYQFVFGHEMTHAIKSQHPQLYKQLMDAAKAMYADDEEFQKRVEDTTELYRSRMGGYFTTDAEGNKVEDMDAYTEEVVADTMGEAIFNAGLMRDIAFNLDHPTLAAIRDAITSLLQHLTGKNLKNAVDSLSVITDVYNQAYEEHKQGKSSEKTKESNKENGQDIDEYKNGDSAPSEEKVKYSLIGEKGASALDHAEEVTTRLDNLAVAREMEEAKKDAKTIKLATGWERGADGKWRYEIPDFTIKNPEEWIKKRTLKLSDVIDDDCEIFKSYPEAKDIVFKKGRSKSGAWYDDGVIEVGLGDLREAMRWHPGTGVDFEKRWIRTVMLHEVQHYIQEKEGFAQGGNSNMIIDPTFNEKMQQIVAEEKQVLDEWNALPSSERSNPLKLSPRAAKIYRRYNDVQERGNTLRKNAKIGKDGYHRLAGEVESRNVEYRSVMTDEERRNSLAEETEDVARKDQIFLFGEGGENHMGTRTNKRMKKVGEYYEGSKDLSKEQQVVIDVFKGSKDRETIHVTSFDGKNVKLEMQQGNEPNSGTRHSLWRHFETASGAYSLDEIVLIPSIVEEGQRKEREKNVVYQKVIDGVRYTVYTDKKGNKEIFHDFYTNRKTALPTSFSEEITNTQSSARTSDNTISVANVANNSDTTNNSAKNLQTGEEVKGLSTAVTDGNSDIKDASGEVVAQTDADHKVKLSLRTYTPWVDNFGRQHEGTRAQVLEYMKKNGFADDQIKYMLDTMDYWYKYFNKLAEFTNPDGTYRFDELHRWNERQPQYKAIGENIENVVSTAIKNGEYAVNQELSTDCIKREAFTKLVNHLIARGADLSAMGPAQINTIKDMMRKYGIQVACDLCFVEGKRLGIVNWAQTFVDDWNKALEAAGFNPDELEDFNFGHYAYDENGNVIGDAAFVPTEEYKNSTQVRAINEAYDLLTQRGKEYYDAMKKRNVANWKQWLKDNQVAKKWKANHKGEKWSESYLTNDQKEIKRSFLTFGVDDPKKIYRNSMEYAKRYAEMEKKYQEKHPGKAFTPTKTQLEDLGKIRNREIRDIFEKMQRLIIEFPEMRKKMQLSDLLGSKGLMQIRQENGEGYAQLWSLILGRFGSGTPKPIQDAVPYSGEIFDITNGLISKAYEEGGARMFSFSDFDITKVFDIMQIYWDMAAREMKLQSYSKEAAYIIMFGKTGAKINMSTLPKAVVSEDLQRRYNDAKKDEERNAAQKEGAEYAGLITDEDGRIVDLSWSEEHSLKPDFCQSIFRDPERNGNCGAVTVGASVNHSIFAAAQPWIRMVIPFHLSGMPIEARKRTDVNWYFDNTPHQNTRVKIGGNWVSIHSEKAKKAKLQDFNFYENEDSEDWDMRQRCRDYLKWCDEKGYTPRFEWGIDSDHYKEWCAGKGYTPNQQIVDIMDNDMTDGVWNGYYKFITDFNAYKPVLDKMGNPVFDENGHLVETVAKHMPVTTNIKLSDAERRAVFGDITGDATEFADMSVLQNRENSINYADANMQKMAAEVQQYLDMTRKHQEGEVTDADIEQAEADMKGEGGTFFNSANDAEILMEAEEEDIPQTFDDFIASDGMKYSIRNEQERQAAENAYDFAKENRPDSYHQYAVLDMSKPGLLPQYYMKQQLADKWRRYANKLQWGNYKMFDLDKPFEENVAKLKGAFPEQYAKYSLRETKFKHELAEWKKQNGLPKTAKEPQVPIRDINETDAEWKQRLAEYRKEAALWKTAPTYEANLVVGNDAEAIYNRALQRKSIQARIVIQDGMLAIREAQNAISREVGSKIGVQEDAYNAENRSHGKAKNEMEEYNHFYLEPLRKAYNALKNQMGGYGYVKNYLMAKHGLERNAYMAFMAAAEEQVKNEIDDIKKQHAKIDAKIAADKSLSAADKQQQRADNKQQEKDEIDKVQSARERLTDYQNDLGRIMNDADYRAGRINFETYRQRDNSIRIQYAPMYLNHRYDKMGIPRDFSGLSALFGNETKRDFELEAGDYVTETENKHGGYTDDLWDAIHAATNKTLFDSYRAGMMTKKQYQSVHDMFQDYIPLRGWNETTADEVWDYVQAGNGAMSSILQAMHGRESIADDPIAYIEQMAQSAIIINNKNDVKQRLLLLARNHPTSLLTLSKAWYIKTTDTQGNEKWIPASPNIPSDVKTSKEVLQYIDQFEQNMELLEKTGDATQKKDGLHIEYPQTTGQEREHEIRVMDRGQEYVIYVNGDPALAQAINDTRSEKVREESGLIDKATAKVGRFLSQVYTSFSPMFVPSNYFRDLTMVSASTAIREDGHYNALLYKNFLQNWGIHKLVAAYSNGSLKQKIDNGTATRNEEDFYNYMMNGGETGYVTSVTVDDFKSKIMSELGKMDEHKLNPKKVWRAYAEAVEFLNRGVEASNRYLVYKTSIEYGRSVEEAINDAKNVTLNFNRKGTGEHGVQVIRNLYLFINPAIQSLQTLGALAKDHPGKLSAVAMAWIASGALVPAFNQAMLSAFGDDDDKDKYWRMAKWDRRNNAILYIPFSKDIFGEANFVKIPLAQEFRAFYGLGDMLASIGSDSELSKQTAKEYASDIMGQILDLMPLDPTGYGGQPLLALMPDALRWPFALAMNTDFTGKPISKESEYNQYMPTYTKAYKGTPDWLVQTSRTINAIGNDFPDEHQNGIDRTGLINPAKADYVLKTLLGGSYTFLSKGAGVATKMLREGPGAISTADVPLWSSFVINPNNRPQSQKQGDGFWDMADQCARVESEIGTIRKEAETNNDFEKLKRYVHSADYREYLDNKDKVDAYQEQKKIEKLVAKGQGDTYKPHKTTADDIYNKHRTIDDIYEDMKLDILWKKLNAYETKFNALGGWSKDAGRTFHRDHPEEFTALRMAKIHKELLSTMKKLMYINGKDKSTEAKMKRVRKQRQILLQELEAATKNIKAPE